MIDSGFANNKKILLLDRTQKQGNDRTWCFWEANENYFENIVHHSWKSLLVKESDQSIDLQMGDYQYKMIRSIDFYVSCFRKVKNYKNIDLVFEDVTAVDTEKGEVTTPENIYLAPIIFSSVLFNVPNIKKKQYYLLQHFKGWYIKTTQPVFNPQQATLMDFIPSNEHTAFVYTMPTSSTEALIEYTFFSDDVFEDAIYEEKLKNYITKNLQGDYTITEKEFGVIPMTNIKFPTQEGKVYFIGTAGGNTKASSGYTFTFIQKQCDEILKLLLQNKLPLTTPQPKRFSLYDSTLLNILAKNKLQGHKVFMRLFAKNPAHKIFKFLDNETTIVEELKIMTTVQQWAFIKAAAKEIFQ